MIIIYTSMTINYFDSTISNFAYGQISYICYEDYGSIPNGCDNIGVTFWDGHFDKHTNIVNMLLLKTKKLLIFAPEPSLTDQFVRFIDLYKNHHQIQIFANAVLNFHKPDNYTEWHNPIRKFIVNK